MPRTIELPEIIGYDNTYVYHEGDSFTFDEGITCLVGCNGSGKSVLIKQIKEYLDENEIQNIVFKTSEARRAASDSLSFGVSSSKNYSFNTMNDIIGSITGSEGETLNHLISQLAYKLGEVIRKLVNSDGKKELWLLLDEVDSGLSLDNIIELKDFLNKLLIPDAKSHGVELYVIVSSNSFELVESLPAISVQTKDSVSFDDYDSYKKFILNSKEMKANREEVK